MTGQAGPIPGHKYNPMINAIQTTMAEEGFTECEAVNCAVSLLYSLLCQQGADVLVMAKLLKDMAVHYPLAIEHAKKMGYYGTNE